MLSVKKNKSKLPTSVNNTNAKKKITRRIDTKTLSVAISENGITSDFSYCYFLNNFMQFSNFLSEHDLYL